MLNKLVNWVLGRQVPYFSVDENFVLNFQVRDDELDELDDLVRDYCHVPPLGGAENLHGKVNILLQTYLSRGRLKSFSLISDQAYISQVSFLFRFLQYTWRFVLLNWTLFSERRPYHPRAFWNRTSTRQCVHVRLVPQAEQDVWAPNVGLSKPTEAVQYHWTRSSTKAGGLKIIRR